jgi:hypothetical protein
MTDLQFPRASPTTADMLNRVKYDASREVNCHLICKIESIDIAKNTITCSSAFKRRMSDDTELEYPVFVDVPLFILSGGGASLFIPPKVGDWCLLCFNDRDIDNWWYSGEVRTPASPRAHSLSDGIAIVGLRPQSDPLALVLDAVTLNAIELPINIKNNDCEIAINAGITLDGKAKKLKIKNSSKGIKELLEDVIDLMEEIITSGNSTTPSGGPVSWIAPIATDFAALKTDVSALFEE